MSDVQQSPSLELDKLYEVKITGKQVFLRIHPPEAGKRANLSDIQKELRRREIPYRHETLFDIYKRASNEFEQLASQEITRFDVQVEVSDDRQQAYMTVVLPDRGQDKLSPARIKEALEAAKVEKGIRYDVIRTILEEQHGVQRALIASGQPREDGQDGRIDLVDAPSERVWVDDNTANYRELDLIKNVNEGELIAHIVYPTPGKAGFDVRARALPARPGKRARFKVGRNVKLNEAGTELYAGKAGYVVRSGERISVENILQVDNVNAETGNIRFYGVVRVKGQVEDTFLIDAEKGIEVAGTVGKATLRSRGDIRIRAGAFGATLESDTSVYARFLSECRVKAGAHVIVDEYILHSDVVAKRTVKVTREPNGFINGGRVRVGTEIWASNVGSDVSEEHTSLEVGGGVNVRKRYDALQERIDTNLNIFENVRKNLLYLQRQRETEGVLEGRKLETYERMLESGRKLIDELLRQGQLHHEMLRSLAEPEEDLGVVFVSRQANAGTTVQIQTSKVNLRDPVETCAFMMVGGTLKAMPYGQALKLHKQMQAQRTRVST